MMPSDVFLSRFSGDVFLVTFSGNVERLRKLVSQEPDLAKVSRDGNTLLMWLPEDEARAKEMIDLLVAYGADPTIRNKDGMTAADHAERRGLYDVAESLRCMERDLIMKSSNHPIWRDALRGLERGDFSRLEPLFDNHSTLDGDKCHIVEWYENGCFDNEPKALAEAFTCACFLGRTSVADFLLTQGVDPAAGTSTGLSAFHWAANRGNLDTVELLIEGKAPLELVNMYGGTVLGCAVWSAINEPRIDHVKIIEALLAAGAKVDEADYPTGNERVDEVLARYRTIRGDSGSHQGKVPMDPKEPSIPSTLEQHKNQATHLVEWKDNTVTLRQPLAGQDAEKVISLMKERGIASVLAAGHMTDGLLARICDLDHVTRLELQGSKQLTDAGMTHLAGLTRLHYLDLSGSRISDLGLEVLRQLPELKTFKLYHQGGVSDAGVANLAHCHHLERVELMGTRTGDGAIKALTGKPKLRHFQAGSDVTDDGLALFHEFPVFKTWQGGEVALSLMEFAAEPNYLWLNLKAPFTNRGLANLTGLDGLFALNLFGSTGMGPFDDSHSAVTAAGLSHLADLPNLGWLGCCAGLGNDEFMSHISSMPRLRMLSCQDAVAGDDGFAALSRSQTVEYIWGRRCHNLTGRGFAALAAMPALRGLSVSCNNVDDKGLSALPRFPALREFMPMDVQDDGFRHVGRCEQLEALECMYCKETTDIATGHIAGLSGLKSYRAWSTRITDRSLGILGGMTSLERLLLYDCAGVTDAGLAFVAGLPRLREVNLESLPGITPEGAQVFPVNVRVNILP
jgi:hypothetical protein